MALPIAKLFIKNKLNTVWRFGVFPILARFPANGFYLLNTPIIAKWLFMHFGDTSHRCAETKRNKVNLTLQH